LGEEVNTQFINSVSPDVVIVATGAIPTLPNIPGIDGENVVQAWDVLEGKVGVGRRAVIVGGNAVGLETALYLGAQGTLSPDELHFLVTNKAESWDTLDKLVSQGNKEVTVVEMSKKAGPDVGFSSRWTLMAELRRLGVKIMTGTKAIRIKPDGLEAEKDKGPFLIGADSIVLATGSESENRIASEIEDMVPELYIIGDAKQPRNALNAISEGFSVALEI
jgi:2,4-dienoyl-CoA reductase (NADPH2)